MKSGDPLRATESAAHRRNGTLAVTAPRPPVVMVICHSKIQRGQNVTSNIFRHFVVILLPCNGYHSNRWAYSEAYKLLMWCCTHTIAGHVIWRTVVRWCVVILFSWKGTLWVLWLICAGARWVFTLQLWVFFLLPFFLGHFCSEQRQFYSSCSNRLISWQTCWHERVGKEQVLHLHVFQQGLRFI